MICTCCQVAKGFAGCRFFNPACLCCGARLIQHLGGLPVSRSECKTRRQAMLAVWVEHGHDEQRIRALVKGKLCIGPDEVTALEHLPSAKPRSRGVK